MTSRGHRAKSTRRHLLSGVGGAIGGAAFYRAMTARAQSDFRGEPKLSGARSGTKILVLGGGLSGLLSAYEMRKAGYEVRILEFQDRAGGRNLTLRNGDTVRELGGAVQKVSFAPGNYFNPGPWRIPYHHQGLLHYCKLFGVKLEPFTQFNSNALLHTADAFGGKPVRYREYAADFQGYTAEILSGLLERGADVPGLDAGERESLRAAMGDVGALNGQGAYVRSEHTSLRRGFDRLRGAGPEAAPVTSAPFGLSEVLKARLWSDISFFSGLDMQSTMFQPVGGMDQIGKAFHRQVADLMRLNARIISIHQDEHGVKVMYEDMAGGGTHVEEADYCICTIPLSILSQLDIQVSGSMKAAINAVPYLSSVKIGLEFDRRFWEEDEQIYGGISFTDQEIGQVAYPSHGFFSSGSAVLLGGYMFGNPEAYDFAGRTPEQRISAALAQGAVLHPQYAGSYRSGVAVAWSRMPWTMGCCAQWSVEARQQHYKDLCAIDGRLILAGEHVSYFCGWQEGAVLSAVDAVARLHKHITQAM